MTCGQILYGINVIKLQREYHIWHAKRKTTKDQNKMTTAPESYTLQMSGTVKMETTKLQLVRLGLVDEFLGFQALHIFWPDKSAHPCSAHTTCSNISNQS